MAGLWSDRSHLRPVDLGHLLLWFFGGLECSDWNATRMACVTLTDASLRDSMLFSRPGRRGSWPQKGDAGLYHQGELALAYRGEPSGDCCQSVWQLKWRQAGGLIKETRPWLAGEWCGCHGCRGRLHPLIELVHSKDTYLPPWC